MPPRLLFGLLLVFGLLASIAMPLRAAADVDCDLFVAPHGPVDSGSGEDPDNAMSLSGASDAAQAGQEVCLLDGVYLAATSPAIRPVNSGSAGSPIVFRAARGASPVVTFAFQANNNKHCFSSNGKSYIELRGITCTGADRSRGPTIEYGMKRGAMIQGGGHNVVEDCRFLNIGGTGGNPGGVAVQIVDSEYNVIRGNEIAHVQDGIHLVGTSSRNLIEKNQLLRVRHVPVSLNNNIGTGTVEMTDNFIQDNRVESPWWSTISTSEVGAERRTRRNVIQRNEILLAMTQSAFGPPGTSNESGILLHSPETIVRFNRVVGGTNGVALVATSSGTLATPNGFRNRVYHNTITGGILNGLSVRGTDTSDDHSESSFVNNALVGNRSTDSSIGMMWIEGAQIRIMKGTLGLQNMEFRNNIVMDFAVGSTPEDVVHIVGLAPTVCTSLADLETDPTCMPPNQDVTFTGNLRGGSAKDAGDFLTTAVSCSGNTIEVADASYFTAGITGLVTGDAVQLEVSPVPATPTTYTITAIDLTTNTLTVSGSPTCTNGQGVSLPFANAAPDIGSELNR